MFIIIGIIAAVMVAATVCSVWKLGEKDGICKYENTEDGEQ